MGVTFDNSRPIYLQITEAFTRKIIAGEYQPGERVASVRELAAAFGVNPNTMQRALAELERQALLYTERTAGRFVTNDVQTITQMKTALAQQLVEQFRVQMAQMGFDTQTLIAMLSHARAEDAAQAERETKGETGV